LILPRFRYSFISKWHRRYRSARYLHPHVKPQPILHVLQTYVSKTIWDYCHSFVATLSNLLLPR